MLAARLTQVDVEGAPLLGAGVEVATFHVEITRADRLGPQSVEQRHLGPRRDAHCRQTGQDRTAGHISQPDSSDATLPSGGQEWNRNNAT